MAASDINIHCISFAPFQWKFSILKTWVHRVWLFIGCKTKLKEIFFWKNICFLQNIRYLFIWKKNVLYWKLFLLKKKFFTEKNITENVKIYIYISFEKYIFMQKVFVLQIKYKSFLNIYWSCNTFFFHHKKYIY